MLLPLIAVVSTLTTRVPPAKIQECQGDKTQQVEDCLSKASAEADATLEKYRARARARLLHDAKTALQDPGLSKTPADFDKAEQTWNAYRDAECGAVFDYWSSGTIAESVELTCQIRLTRLHTHTIWREWLTYFDSTPPLLPEPAVSAEP
jgi:uncharacterized protein YecT (DUF1311 family)